MDIHSFASLGENLVKNKQPLYEDEYQKRNNEMYPVLKIVCNFKNRNIPFTALADTGCYSGIVLLKDEVEILKNHFEDFELGDKINSEPLQVGVADGHIVGADAYRVKIELDGELKETILLVVNSEYIIGHEKEEKTKIDDIFPLVGRDFLDHFDVLFKGKERKISVFI